MSRASEAELIDSENLDPGFQFLAGHSKFRSGTLTRWQQEWDWLLRWCHPEIIEETTGHL
jgi:hypothetical protein